MDMSDGSPNRGEFTIVIPSHRPHLAKQTESALAPLPTVHWDGSGYPSFSKLINDCIVHCKTEIVVICSDKVTPSPAHIEKMLLLLKEGYALVGLFSFACIGFSKELIRRIGFFDERFVSGECEDSDFMVRMREADVGFYLTKEVPYTWMASSWDNRRAREHFIRKWGSIHMSQAVRQLPEERYSYDLGEPKPRRFLPHSSSVGG